MAIWWCLLLLPATLGEGGQPRECQASQIPAAAAPAPPRVAVVFRGEVFRGLNFDFHFSRDAADRRTDALRRKLPCLNSSYALQRALARNQVRMLLEPLEARGVAVDVFLASYGCWDLVDDVSDDRAAAWWRDVRSWYGDHRVKFSEPVKRAKFQSQQTTISRGLDAALAAGESYRSLIVWRFDVAAFAPIAGPPGATLHGPDVAPTDFLLSDGDEGGLINGDVGWTLPWRFASCFAAMQRPPTFDLASGAPTGKGCWAPGAESANGGQCTQLLDGVMRRSGAKGLRKNWPCFIDADHPKPAFALSAGSIDRRGSPFLLSRWMADNGHVLEAGKPPRWPWLCPKPAIVQRFSGSRDGALCAFLKAGEADLHCDQAHLLREICVRLRGDAENFAAIGCAPRRLLA